MENDESVFIYKTIRERKPTNPASKGVRISKLHNDLEKEFIKRGMNAFDDSK